VIENDITTSLLRRGYDEWIEPPKKLKMSLSSFVCGRFFPQSWSEEIIPQGNETLDENISLNNRHLSVDIPKEGRLYNVDLDQKQIGMRDQKVNDKITTDIFSIFFSSYFLGLLVFLVKYKNGTLDVQTSS